MNDPRLELIDAIWSDAIDRGALLARALAEAKRRRVRRQMGRAALLALPVAAAFLLLLWNDRTVPGEFHGSAGARPGPTAAMSIPQRAGVEIVHSLPLPAACWVETKTGSAPVVGDKPDSAAIVATNPSNAPEHISTEQLWALLGDRPAMLIWRPDQTAELVMVK